MRVTVILAATAALLVATPALARDPNCKRGDKQCELLQGFSELQLIGHDKGEDAVVRCAVKTGQPKPSDPRNPVNDTFKILACLGG